LTSWLYWIVLNALSAVLYAETALTGYFILSIVYTGLSVVGYFEWRKIYRNNAVKN
jgi:hypothetical protein